MAGDEPIAIKLDKDAEEKISEELTEKLTNEYDMDDGADDLVRFIVLLIKNNRTQAHIKSEIESFLSKERADEFTSWLWDKLGSLRPASTKRKLGSVVVDVSKNKRQTRTFAGSSKLLDAAVSASVASVTRKPKVVKKRLVSARSKDTSSSAGSAAPKPSASQRRVSQRAAVVRRVHPQFAAGMRPPAPYLRPGAMPFTPNAQAALLANPAVAAAFQAGLRAAAARPPARGPPPANKKKARCTFFPNCTKGAACPFIHPSQPCKFFPNCQWGNKCIYVHPKCKYGVKCTAAHCKFSHPPGRKLTPGGGGGGGSVPCRFGDKCTRADCKFQHPNGKGGDNTAGNSKTGDKVCRFDPKCRKISCSFAHPKREAQERAYLGKGDPNEKDADDVAKLSATLPSTPPQDNGN